MFVAKTIAPGDPGANPANDEGMQMPTATAKPTTKATTVRDAAAEQTRVERTTELSEQVLEQVKGSQEKAIEAVRKFMESVDEALPPHGENPSRRQEVIDSALEDVGEAGPDPVRLPDRCRPQRRWGAGGVGQEEGMSRA